MNRTDETTWKALHVCYRAKYLCCTPCWVGEGQQFLPHHLHIKHFLRGVSHCKPSTMYRFPFSELIIVLQALTGPRFEPIGNIPMRILTWKIVFLISATTGNIIHEKKVYVFQKTNSIFHVMGPYPPRFLSFKHKHQVCA